MLGNTHTHLQGIPRNVWQGVFEKGASGLNLVTQHTLGAHTQCTHSKDSHLHSYKGI